MIRFAQEIYEADNSQHNSERSCEQKLGNDQPRAMKNDVKRRQFANVDKRWFLLHVFASCADALVHVRLWKLGRIALIRACPRRWECPRWQIAANHRSILCR